MAKMNTQVEETVVTYHEFGVWLASQGAHCFLDEVGLLPLGAHFLASVPLLFLPLRKAPPWRSQVASASKGPSMYCTLDILLRSNSADADIGPLSVFVFEGKLHPASRTHI